MKKLLITFCMAIFLLTGCSLSIGNTPRQPESSAQVANFGMTFEQFKAAYNAMITENFPSTGWDISSVTLESAKDKDVFIYKFDDNVGLMGATDKNSGMVKEVLVVLVPKTQNEMGKALLAYVTLMLTLSPELTVEQRGELIKELKLVGEDVTDLLNQNDGVAVRGNVIYRTKFIKERGVLHFIASAKEE